VDLDFEYQRAMAQAEPDKPAGDDAAAALAGPEAVEPVLTEPEQNALIAMLQLKAVHANARRTAADIAAEASGPETDVGTFKRPLARLKQLGLAGSHPGQSGGSWLTDKGIALAKKLQQPLSG
jgi:hypothetical protein